MREKDSALIGTWILKKGETGVGPEVVTVPVGPGIPPQVIVSLNKVAVIDEGKKKECKFEVYPGKNPRKLDILDVIDDHEGMLWPLKCIFEVEKDSLKVCIYHGISRFGIPYLDPKTPRPPNFLHKEYIPWFILYFEKEKKMP